MPVTLVTRGLVEAHQYLLGHFEFSDCNRGRGGRRRCVLTGRILAMICTYPKLAHRGPDGLYKHNEWHARIL